MTQIADRVVRAV